ncbi:MAG: MFS transporter [Vulcanimicrobiaceae bacterium]
MNSGNVLRLAVAQALAGANSVVFFATGAIIGNALAPSKALATLPISIFVVGMVAGTLPTGVIAHRFGRRTAFLAGTSCGVLTGLLSAFAILSSSFWLFCAATFLGGVYNAVVLSFRFAAADGVPAERRARALSAVMAGGVFAGVIGPQLVTHTMHLWPSHIFAATFVAQAGVAAISALILWGVRLPKPILTAGAGGRSLIEIVRQFRFVAAVICGAVSYMLMNFVMTAAPLAMHLCGIPTETSNLGLQWHVLAMYTPSFFTGRLMTRFGVAPIVAVGLVLLAASGAVGLTGIQVSHFWLSLILLGLGWNFSFLGASAMILDCHTPAERTKVQSLNDFIVFGSMAVGSFSSGALLTSYGWDAVLWVFFIPLAIAVAALATRTWSAQISGRIARAAQ